MQLLKSHPGIIIVCAMFLLLGFLRLNDRSLLTPDSAQYLIWGNSLAHGDGFTDNTHPIPDKFVNHGPLYSLLIAPVELFYPLSVKAVKAWTVCFGVIAIIACYFVLLRLAGKTIALFGTIFFATNPLLLIYSTEVLSDIPFIAFLLVSLYSFFQIEDKNKTSKAFFVFFIAVTIGVVLLREIGYALIIAYTGWYLFKKDWKHALLIAGSVLFIVVLWNIRNHFLVEKSPFSQGGNMPWIFNHVITSNDTSLFIEIPVRFWHNIKSYANFLFGMMLFPTYETNQLHSIFNNASSVYNIAQTFFLWGKYVVFLLVSAIAIPGAYFSIRRSHKDLLLLLFLFAYLLILLIFPFNDVRYMIPLVPFLIYYWSTGFDWLISTTITQYQTARWKRWGFVLIFLCILPNAIAISEIIRNNIRSNEKPVLAWRELGAWIQEHTPPDCIIASPIKDLAIVVGGNRKVIDVYPSIATPSFEFLMRDFQVDYLLSPSWYEDATVFDFQENASTRLKLEHCFSAGGLHLFNVQSALQQAGQSNKRLISSGSISNSIQQAHQDILNEQYAEAKKILNRAYNTAPQRPDVVFENLLCSAFLENSEETGSFYRQLITLPSDVGIYVGAAQQQVSALNKLLQTRKSESPEEQSVEKFAVASAYWKSGYYKRSFSIMKELLQNDSTYFSGLLWGTHYAIQLRDLTSARKYFSQLQAVDSVNSLVRTYKTILAIYDSIANSTVHSIRSGLHLELAKQYLSLQLPEEAMDEAERAMGEDRANDSALRFMGELLEKKSLPQIATKLYKQLQ